MGHPEKGCIVAPGVAEFHVRYALPASDIIAPNLVELEILCGHPVANVDEAVSAARELIAQGAAGRAGEASGAGGDEYGSLLRCCW